MITINSRDIYSKFLEIADTIPIPIIVVDFNKQIFTNNEAKNVIKTIFGSFETFETEIRTFSGLYKKIMEQNDLASIYRHVAETGDTVKNVFFTVINEKNTEYTMLMNISLLNSVRDMRPIAFLTSFENLTEVFNFNRELHYSMANLKGVIDAFARDRVAYLLAYGEQETVRHLIEVRNFTEMIADSIMKNQSIPNKEILEYSKITPLYIRMLELSAMLHDFGKIEPDVHNLIVQPRKLTEEEFKTIKSHPRFGADLIGYDNEILKMCWLVALYHHERWDGSGYPEGLKERDIPLSARIVGFADMYSALKNRRKYKEAVTDPEELKALLYENRHGFDPVVFETGMRLLPQMEDKSAEIEAEYRNFELTSEEAVKLITDVFNNIMSQREKNE